MSTASTVNLIDDKSVTVGLIDDPLAWRVRSVEEIVIDTATSCLRRRSVQVSPLRTLLAARAAVSGFATDALVALPVAPMPRGPLLEFDVSGPYGDGWLLPRVEIADRQALYLEELAVACGLTVSPALRASLAAVVALPGDVPVPRRQDGTVDEESVAQYLADGTGMSIPEAARTEWIRVGERCAAVLRSRADRGLAVSAPEQPLLALPGLFVRGVVSTVDEATDLLHDYATTLEAAAGSLKAGAIPNSADDFLNGLADYASYYDLIVALRVPLDEPFLVKTSERRDLSLSLIRNSAEQELVVADSLSNHVSFRIDDPNVRISSFELVNPAGAFPYGLFTTRSNPQSRAIYAYEDDREYRVALSFRLGLLRRLQMVPYLASVLVALLAAALCVDRPHDLRTLAVVVGPTAFAASILLAREPSTLGSRLRLVSSVVLGVSLGLLMVIATTLFLSGP